MKHLILRGTVGLSLLAGAALVLSGCEKSPQGGAKPQGTQVAKDDHKDDHKEGATKPHDHSGWWCDEHGVPEGECSMCNAKVAKAFKDKGDWCEKHERAKSQCFICDPKLKDKYAAVYQAKNGKAPPEPKENMPKKDGN